MPTNVILATTMAAVVDMCHVTGHSKIVNVLQPKLYNVCCNMDEDVN